MLRIKTHTPIKSGKKIVRVSDEYSCEIIYFHDQLYNYTDYTTNIMYEYDDVDFTYDKTYNKIKLIGVDVSSESLKRGEGTCQYKLQYGPNSDNITDGETVKWKRVGTRSVITFTLPNDETITIHCDATYKNITKITYSNETWEIINNSVIVIGEYSGDYDFRDFDIIYNVNEYDENGNVLLPSFTFQYNHKSDILNVTFSNIQRGKLFNICDYIIFNNNNEILDENKVFCTWKSETLQDGLTERFKFNYSGVYKPTIRNHTFSSWDVINQEKYKEQTENSHYLVFRRNGFEDFNKKMTNNYPIDVYGTSLLLVNQLNTFSTSYGSFNGVITRWNGGEDCFALDLDGNEKYLVINGIDPYERLKQITGLTDKKFEEIFKTWEFVSYNINKTTMDLPLEMNSDYTLNLNQEDLFNNDYCEKVINENINNVIDYEKRQFVLSYLSNFEKNENKDDYALTLGNGRFRMKGSTVFNDDKYLHIANSLTFDLYFRERNVEETTIDYDGVLYNDYGAWETSDENYWFDYKIEDSGIPTTLGGDLLGNLGFTDEDVLYQKDCLKKSFLRLSIYDSPNRETQKLLYYSTLFFDTNVLYKKYLDYYVLNNGSKQVKYEEHGVQYVYREESGLKASFTCTNKFNSSASSDGFYAYLFDTTVQGSDYTQLYLKVEFNNAKTGKTVPFIWPGETNTSGDGYTLIGNYNSDIKKTDTRNGKNGSKWLKKCPQNFIEDIPNGSGDTYTQPKMVELLNSLYIPIGVKYNFITKEYVWFILNTTRANICPLGDGNLKLVLFEPRINK